MVTNTYTVNGETAQQIFDGSADIDMSREAGVKAGCSEYPIPLLNKITVTSTEGIFSKSESIYAGYKVVDQLLGEIVEAGNYNPNNPILNTIIANARFGMFEPAHYRATDSWVKYNMNAGEINSLINVGRGVKICVKIKYTKTTGSTTEEYVPIPVADANFSNQGDKAVPRYEVLGVQSALAPAETVQSRYIDSPDRRTWFDSVLNSSALNINLNNYITDPDMGEDITVTLMAYIGTRPTANNTFPILPMSTGSSTSITCRFETYNPTIAITNKDTYYNPDAYEDKYGSVAEYDETTDDDTKISISIVAP